MSKGAWKRPVVVSHETYSRNWDRIFGRPEPEVDYRPLTEEEFEPTGKALEEEMEKARRKGGTSPTQAG